MKKLLSLLLTLVLIFTFVGCNSGNTSQENQSDSSEAGEGSSAYDSLDKIYIGACIQRSGSKVSMGDKVYEGNTMAIDEINAAGGILGKQIEYVVVDSGETTQEAVTAATKLCERGDISVIIGSLASSDSIAVSGVISEYKIPLISNGSSANVWKENNEYIWQIRSTDDLAGPILAQVATDTLDVKNPAIIYCSNSFGTGMYESIKATLEDDYQMDFAVEISFDSGETNFSPLIAQVADSGCDGLFAIADGTEAALIMKQAYTQNLDIPCLGSSTFSASSTIESAGFAESEGWYTVADWVPTLGTEKSDAFVENWYKYYDGQDLDPIDNNIYSYDEIYLLKQAIETAGSADPAAINDALATISYEGAMTTYTANENRSFATSQAVTRNDGKGGAEVVSSLTFR